MPVDHLHRVTGEGTFGPADRYFTVTLEYGEDHDKVNPFDVSASRLSQQTATGLDGRYLHPVVRLFQEGKQVAEHHLTENLENEWDSEDVHRAPLVRFLTEHLTADGSTPGSSAPRAGAAEPPYFPEDAVVDPS